MKTRVMLKASYLMSEIQDIKHEIAMNIVRIKPHHARNDDLRDLIEKIERLQSCLLDADDIIKDFSIVDEIPY